MFLNKPIRQLLPMIQLTIRAANRKLSSVLMQVMEVVMQDIQVMDRKDLNLIIAKKIGDSLASVGYNVVYTRSDDSSLSTEDRITSINSQKAKYLISIQMNSSSDSLSKGYSIFTQPNDNMIHLAKKLAQTMNSINLSQFEGIDSDHYENFPILYDSQIPSILLELGYLSNSEDYTKLTDETFQQKIANAITESFLDQIN